MEKIRIGNDIMYEWVILRHDKYIEDFTVANIIELKISNDSTGDTYLPAYDINNNVITVYFPASVQSKCGVYSLHINYIKKKTTGSIEEAEYTVDYEGAFELVAQTSEESPVTPEDGKVTSYVYRNRDGADGITPEIGSNGNWFIGYKDTGKPSTGKPFTYDMFTPDQLEELIYPAIEANKGYTDTEIARIIGAAPEMLDTLEEIAKALQEGGEVAEALGEAIALKLNKTDAEELYVPKEGYTPFSVDEKEKLKGLKNYDDSINDIRKELGKTIKYTIING